MNMDKYLPIGTVVILKNGEKKLMITGFHALSMLDNKPISFDYSGCMYPEGVLSSDESFLFNHDMINEVCFIGYENEEEKEFNEKLKENEELILNSIKSPEEVNSNNTLEETKESEIPKNKTDVFDKLRL